MNLHDSKDIAENYDRFLRGAIMRRKPGWPDYENCIANLPNSIMKYTGTEPVGKTLPLADRYLQKEYKNVVVLLLDGMGKYIIENILDESGPFRTHLAGCYQSVFYLLRLRQLLLY